VSRSGRAWFVLLAVALVVTVASVALAGPSTKRIVFDAPTIMPVIAVLTVVALVLLAACILIALWRRPAPSAAARVCIALVALVVGVIVVYRLIVGGDAGSTPFRPSQLALWIAAGFALLVELGVLFALVPRDSPRTGTARRGKGTRR
jgi:hypothetical protein